MSKKIKLALLALLGFSTACSTVKNGTKDKDAGIQTVEELDAQIRVLYGVRPPTPVMPTEESGATAADDEAPRTEDTKK